ncbi:MAG: type 4a pilus biogenesis protein PilO [Candidatus Aminicenantia bacterium]
MLNLKYKTSKIFVSLFILILILIFFTCKSEKGKPEVKEKISVSKSVFKFKNFNPEKRVEKFLKAVKDKDFKTIFDTTYYYQMELSQIKSNNPKVLWEKLITEYYESKKNAVLKGEKKSSIFDSTSPFAFIIEPTKDIRALMNLLNPPCKWKVIETRRELKRDESSGRQYDVFEVYVSLNYPKVEESPLIDSKLLKERIWSIYMDAKTGLYIRHYYVAEGDVYWENVPLRVLSVSWNADSLMGLSPLKIRVIGGTPPYNSTTKCGNCTLENLGKVKRLEDDTIRINIGRDEWMGFRRCIKESGKSFPLQFTVITTDKSGYRDVASFTVPEVFGAYCWIANPWYKWGQGPPDRCYKPMLLKHETLTSPIQELTPLERQRLNKLEAEIERLNIILEDSKRIIPEKKEISDILRKIQQLASDSHLTITKFTPKGEVEKEFYSEYPISIEMTGNYHNLAIFFDCLSKFSKLFNVDDISIKALSSLTEDTTISISCIAKTYFFSEAEKGLLKKTKTESIEPDWWASEKFEQLKKQKELIEKKIFIIYELKIKRERRERPTIMMNELNKNLPSGLWLTELKYHGNKVELKGKTTSNSLIANFISNLERSSYFRDINLIDTTQKRIEGEEILEFFLSSEFTVPIVRVNGAIKAIKPPKLIKRVEPVYPEIAKQAKVEGVVILEVTTDIHGRVRNVKLLRSIPLLDQAAIDAVRQWVYEPMIIDGKLKGVTFMQSVQFKIRE